MSTVATAGREVPAEAAGPIRLEPLVPEFEACIAAQVFPGAVVAVATAQHERLSTLCVGRRSYDATSSPVEVGTVYDLASLTKLMVTTAVTMTLVADGRLDLSTPIATVLDEFRGGGREAITFGQLLSHTSGLPAWRPLFRSANGKQDVECAALAVPLEQKPGQSEIYSDIGFILLGVALERLCGAPLGELFAGRIAKPLRLSDSGYGPLEIERMRIAPTEFDPLRGETLVGDVHDENAAAMGGVAGHAGLFATAVDVGTFGASLLRGSRPRFVDAAVADAFVRRGGQESTWRYGVANPSAGTTYADLVDPGAYLVTGFTGTLLLVDSSAGLAVTILTNRVHPTRADRGYQLRRDRLLTGILQLLPH